MYKCHDGYFYTHLCVMLILLVFKIIIFDLSSNTSYSSSLSLVLIMPVLKGSSCNFKTSSAVKYETFSREFQLFFSGFIVSFWIKKFIKFGCGHFKTSRNRLNFGGLLLIISKITIKYLLINRDNIMMINTNHIICFKIGPFCWDEGYHINCYSFSIFSQRLVIFLG